MYSFVLSRCLLLTILAPILGGSNTTPSHQQVHSKMIRGFVNVTGRPIHNSRVHIFGASAGAFGSASVPYLSVKDVALHDAVGPYVVTDEHGLFSASISTPCVPGQILYIYSIGGNLPGFTKDNPVIGIMAVIGKCTSAGTFPTLSGTLNADERTTVETAFSFSGHATDPTHVSMASEPKPQAASRLR